MLLACRTGAVAGAAFSCTLHLQAAQPLIQPLRVTPLGRQHLSRCCSSRQQPQLWESALEQVPSGAMSQPCYV